MIQVKTLSQIDTILGKDGDTHDFIIRLNFGAYSRKEIQKCARGYQVFHSIDGSIEYCTPKALLRKTNIKCKAFRGLANVCAEYLKKGSLVAIEGKLMIGKDKKNIVHVDNMLMLDKKFTTQTDKRA